MNETQFKTLFPNASKSTIAANIELHDPKSEHHATKALELVPQRTEKSTDRFKVRITSCRVRAVDPDNLCGGCKPILDVMRCGGLIPDDNPFQLTLEISQEKVKTYADERTIIEITPL